jgi:hypothetical protein
MRKTENSSKLLFNSLGIKQTSELLGRKIEVSFFHKLDTSWYFIQLCFVVQSCVLELAEGFPAELCFPWIPLEQGKAIRLIIVGSEDYLVQYKSPITIDKPVQTEIQQFAQSSKKMNELSRGKYKLL